MYQILKRKNSTYRFAPEFENEKKNRVIALTLGNHWYLKKVEKTCPSNAYRQRTIKRALIFELLFFFLL